MLSEWDLLIRLTLWSLQNIFTIKANLKILGVIEEVDNLIGGEC